MDNLLFATQNSVSSRQLSNLSLNTNLTSSFQTPKIVDPIQYVNDLTGKPSVTLEKLQNARRTIQNSADETNTQLKKNVYKNYQLFIDTSKEISYLKKENSHVSKLLTEQTKVLDSIMSISIGGSKTGLTPSEKKEALEKVKEERERKMLAMSKSQLNGPLPTLEFRSLIDSIEGGAGILENKLNSLVYQEGELIELDDGQDYKEVGHVNLILLNDSLIITTPLNSFSKFTTPLNQVASPRKYKFHSIIDLEQIAVVNVKDRSFRKYEHAFKILMSATTKVFLTVSVAKKKAWVESFDIAKKYRRTSRLQRRDTTMSIAGESGFDTVMSPTADAGFAKVGLNPFEEQEEQNEETASELPYWLTELPDDLDVCIAQRNFEEAVKLVNRAQEHFLYPKCCDNQMQMELKLKIDNKICELVEALSSELNVPPDRSIQTGPRASRQAVLLLLRLGKSLLAIQLFLDQRSRIMKFVMKQTRSSCESAGTMTFMKRMSNAFFGNIVETCKEFLRAFEINSSFLGLGIPTDVDNSFENSGRRESDVELLNDDQPSSGSNSNSPTVSFSHSALASLNLWTYQQFEIYLSLFPRHVFNAQTPLSVVVDCFAVAHRNCFKLCQSIGIDFSFVFYKQMHDKIQRLIQEIREKFVDAVKLRFSESANQQSQVFDSKEKFTQLQNELQELGLNVEDYCRNDQDNRSDPPKPLYVMTLMNSTTSFSKAFMALVGDLTKITIHPVLVRTVNETIVEGFKEQMRQLVYCVKNSKNSPKPRQLVSDPEDLLHQNIAFHLDNLLPLAIRKYCDSLKVATFNELQVLAKDYAYLKKADLRSPNHDNEQDYYSSNDSPIQSKANIELYNDSLDYSSPVPAPRARRTQIQIRSNGTASPHRRESSASPSRSSGKLSSNNAGTYL